MEYSPALRKAIRKWDGYIKKEEKYRTLFFKMKKEKWYAEVKKLYRQEWDAFATAVREKQKEQQEIQDADLSTIS